MNKKKLSRKELKTQMNDQLECRSSSVSKVYGWQKYR